MSEPTSTYAITHSAGCWRWHHQCGVRRIHALTAALREVLAEYRTANLLGGEEYLTATTRAGLIDEWHHVLELAAMDVAGADVLPDPAAPATTT